MLDTAAVVGTIEFGRRFNGPPTSANGGYACGRIAAFVDGPARVTLRKPPPLETELAVRRTATGGVEVYDADVLIATAEPVVPNLVVAPARPSIADARAARNAHPWLTEEHVLSGCFVCGPRRTDGLGVTPGLLAGYTDVDAAPFVPDATVAGSDGIVPSEIVWAALDCSRRSGDAVRVGPAAGVRYRGARLIALDGLDHYPWRGDSAAVIAPIREFLGAGPVRSQVRTGLTAREREIAVLVAAGLTDAEIAGTLTLSPHTVHRHVANIRTKLGVSTRAAVAAHAARNSW